MAIYDLFVSYSSKDRVWAKKFWEDVRVRYPALRIFWDRDSIPAGDGWRNVLLSALRNSKHLVVFWSEYANASLEVGPEIESFRAHRDITPQLEGSDRKGFYVPLEGNRGGGIADYQGFDDFRTIYKPLQEDRGIGGILPAGQGQQAWDRMIRMVGDAVSHADRAQPVIAAVAATTEDAVTGLLDLIHGKKAAGTRITLDQLLAGFNLQWTDVRNHYGPSALDWKPTGDRTIVELLEGVRVTVNAKLDPSDRFRWEHVDLTTDEGLDLAENLHKRPSVVIFDPVSLYDPSCSAAIRRLNLYVLEKQSVILSLSPALKTDEDVYGMCLRDLSLPLFDDYFHPRIPPIGEFAARCLPEVQRVSQIERLVRNRIRDLRFATDIAAGKGTTGTI